MDKVMDHALAGVLHYVPATRVCNVRSFTRQGFSESGWAREVFINVFSVADLCHQDHKGIIMNFVNDAVISRSCFVKLVVSLHFCYSRVRKIFSEGVYFPLYSYQFLLGKRSQILFDSGPELYCVCHFIDPVFSRTARLECPHPVL